ncbi:hypothetical protein [Methylobacterium frigidaeris]|nr:hypothetical protein [Methylobacterium frigidaeris]
MGLAFESGIEHRLLADGFEITVVLMILGGITCALFGRGEREELGR